ncbi:hypothetical protein K501DRAFT_332069 [Backusella circina FSU 941]|nr:hypothetical protein K501DRAFT_332069 [Backusella circina FSU 941]
MKITLFTFKHCRLQFILSTKQVIFKWQKTIFHCNGISRDYSNIENSSLLYWSGVGNMEHFNIFVISRGHVLREATPVNNVDFFRINSIQRKWNTSRLSVKVFGTRKTTVLRIYALLMNRLFALPINLSEQYIKMDIEKFASYYTACSDSTVFSYQKMSCFDFSNLENCVQYTSYSRAADSIGAKELSFKGRYVTKTNAVTSEGVSRRSVVIAKGVRNVTEISRF